MEELQVMYEQLMKMIVDLRGELEEVKIEQRAQKNALNNVNGYCFTNINRLDKKVGELEQISEVK